MNHYTEMSDDDKLAAFDKLQLFIESAVESEQDAPAVFKPETEKRIELVLVNIRELLGLPKVAHDTV